MEVTEKKKKRDWLMELKMNKWNWNNYHNAVWPRYLLPPYRTPRGESLKIARRCCVWKKEEEEIKVTVNSSGFYVKRILLRPLLGMFFSFSVSKTKWLVKIQNGDRIILIIFFIFIFLNGGQFTGQHVPTKNKCFKGDWEYFPVCIVRVQEKVLRCGAKIKKT